MTKLIIASVDLDGITVPALKVLRAAVGHARTHQDLRLHTMKIEDFGRLAELPGLSREDLIRLLGEASRATVLIESIDTTAHNREDVPFLSWPIFNSKTLDQSNISFEISAETFDENVMARLSNKLDDKIRAFKSPGSTTSR